MTEQGNGQREDLLEMLTERLKCTYLSDLKTPEHKTAIAGVLATISPEAYSLAQWNEALSYLCGSGPCETSQKAQEQLLALCR